MTVPTNKPTIKVNDGLKEKLNNIPRIQIKRILSIGTDAKILLTVRQFA